MKSTGTITFPNAAQATLFELELKGQLSDGAWENTNHDWSFWCNLEVRVAEELEECGLRPARPAPIKRGYAFYRQLECIRDRMKVYVRLGERYGLEGARTLESLMDMFGDLCTEELLEERARKFDSEKSDHWARRLKALRAIPADRLAEIKKVWDSEEICDDGKLKAVCRGIKQVMATDL